MQRAAPATEGRRCFSWHPAISAGSFGTLGAPDAVSRWRRLEDLLEHCEVLVTPRLTAAGEQPDEVADSTEFRLRVELHEGRAVGGRELDVVREWRSP